MYRIAWRALRSRRTQSATLVLLAALVAGGAVAAPFFVYAATERLTVRVIGAATGGERDVTVSHDVDVRSGGPAALARAETDIANALVLPNFVGRTSLRVVGSSGPKTNPVLTVLSAHVDVCSRVAVTGRCPTALGETLVSSATAQRYGLRVGGVATFASQTIAKPVKLRIVGLYRPLAPDDAYWGRSTLAASLAPEAGVGVAAIDAFLVTPATILATDTTDVVVDRDLVVQAQALSVRSGLADNTAINEAVDRLRPDGYRISFDFTVLVNQIVAGTNQIFIAVALGALEVVLFGWFALFLAIRATAIARRFDVGILKLRGVQRRKLWTLMTEQSLLPLLAGAPIGFVGGFLGARLDAGPVRATADVWTAVLFAIAGVVVAVLGGLGAALLAEREALATPVGDLLRNTPTRRRGWRADVVDGLLVLLAIVGVVEIRTSSATGSTISILAPGLIAFAIGLGAARLLVPLSNRAIAAARRSGRLPSLLTYTYLARRPGLDRLFALLTIGVALCGYAVFASGTAALARTDRATLEVGATRVLTVGPITPLHLMAAVRSADPSGRYAMAVTQITDPSGHRILAVDSARLAAVLPAGAAGATLAAKLRPASSDEVTVTGSSMQLDADASGLQPGHTTYLLARLMGSEGPVIAPFGPLRPSATTYTAATPACTDGGRCELIGFALSDRPNPDSPLANAAAPGTSVQITGVRQLAPAHTILGVTDMGSDVRWRTTASASGIGPIIETSADGLSMTVPSATFVKDATLDATAYLDTVPTPVPVVVAGAAVRTDLPGVLEVSPFGFDEVPVRIAGSTDLLPRLEGTGLLIDLDYAQALAGPQTTGATPEVWLGPRAPADVMTRLTRAGITPLGIESTAAQAATYGDAPTVVGLRFQVVAGVVGIAIGAMSLLLVGSVERRPRARDLVALRHQGVTAKAARAVVIRGYAILAGGAALVGIAAGVLDRLLAGQAPLFTDRWHVLPRPTPLPGSGLLFQVVAVVVALGFGAVLAAYQLTRAIEVQVKEGA